MKKSVVIAIVLVMLFSMTAVSFADASGAGVEDENFQEELIENVLLPDDTVIEDQDEPIIEPYSSSSITLKAGFNRKPGKGHATVQASCVIATKMTSTITLQEYSKAKGQYINSNVKSATLSKAGVVIGHQAIFTLSSAKTYRIKITIKAKGSTRSYTKIDYRRLK